jgi:hypothetical protein
VRTAWHLRTKGWFSDATILCPDFLPPISDTYAWFYVLRWVSPPYDQSPENPNPVKAVAMSHGIVGDEDRIVVGHKPEGFVVPEGEVWRVCGSVVSGADVIVYGTLVMPDIKDLRFVSDDPDVALWILGGVLTQTPIHNLRVAGSGESRPAQETPKGGVVVGAEFQGDDGAAVLISETPDNRSAYDFVRCTVQRRRITDGIDLEPTDFLVESMAPGSEYRVQRSDGTAYRLNPDGSSTPIKAFA